MNSVLFVAKRARASHMVVRMPSLRMPAPTPTISDRMMSARRGTCSGTVKFVDRPCTAWTFDPGGGIHVQ